MAIIGMRWTGQKRGSNMSCLLSLTRMQKGVDLPAGRRYFLLNAAPEFMGNVGQLRIVVFSFLHLSDRNLGIPIINP
jgi:hypothetical protein